MFCVIHLSLRKELVAHFVSFHVWVCVHTQKRPIVINCFWFQKTTAAKEEEEEIQKNHCTKHRMSKEYFSKRLFQFEESVLCSTWNFSHNSILFDKITEIKNVKFKLCFKKFMLRWLQIL